MMSMAFQDQQANALSILSLPKPNLPIDLPHIIDMQHSRDDLNGKALALCKSHEDHIYYPWSNLLEGGFPCTTCYMMATYTCVRVETSFYKVY